MAAYWYARSAERGEPTAYLSLATMLSSHAEDHWTLTEAATFAFLAVERLDEGTRKNAAKEILAQLREKLTDSAVDIARRQAAQWCPLQQETRLMTDPTQDNCPSDVLLN